MFVVRSQHVLRWSWLRLAALWALCGLGVLAASCGAPASAPSPSASRVPDHRLAAPTCAALRAAVRTAVPGPTSSVASGHRTYNFTLLGPLPAQKTWHPGDTMRFLWCAVPGPLTASAQPAVVVLTVAMAGPFASRAGAAGAQLTLSRGPGTGGMPSTSPTPAAGSLVASPRSLQTDAWTATDQTATISWPTTLAPGFYVFVASQRIGLDTSTGEQGGSDSSGIVQVTPT